MPWLQNSVIGEGYNGYEAYSRTSDREWLANWNRS